MIWKTWTAEEDYTENELDGIVRLSNNYEDISWFLNSNFGTNISMSPIFWGGYSTIPFADFLQNIEDRARDISVFSDYQHKEWRAGMPITYEDINRWEEAGRVAEENMLRGAINLKRCGTFSCGR